MQYTAVVQEAAGRLLSGWDGIFVVLFLFAVLIVAAILTRTRLVIAIMAIYVSSAILSLLLTPAFPRISEILAGSGINAGVFLTLVIVTGSILGASVLKTTTRKKADKFFSYRLVYAFAMMGLLLSSVLGQLPPEGFQSFAPFMWRLLGSSIARIIWMLAPLGVMLVMRERTRRR